MVQIEILGADSINIVVYWRSNFLLRNPPKKKSKLEELREIKLENIDLYQANSQLFVEISDLKM